MRAADEKYNLSQKVKKWNGMIYDGPQKAAKEQHTIEKQEKTLIF